MKYPLSLYVIILIGLINLLSCSDDPTSIGIDLLEGDYLVVSTFDTQDDTVTQSSSFYREVVPLGFATYVLIGKRDGLESNALMNFLFVINDSLQQDFLDDNITVNQAFMELTPAYTFTDEAAEFDFTVHEITSDWSIDFTADSLDDLSFNAENLSSNKNFTDSIYTFDLNSDFVLQWIKNSIDTSLGKNYGLYFIPTMGTGKVVGFEALTPVSSNAAKLKVVIEKPGIFVDTIRAFIFADVSAVVTDLPNLPAEDIGVQASTTIQSKLYFDLSEIPPDISINKAELILTEDTLYSVTGSSFNSNLAAYRITDSTDLTVDESRGILLARSNHVYTGNITTFITNWLNNNNNMGIVIRSASLTERLELFALKGSTFPDLSERPRLRIVYTLEER